MKTRLEILGQNIRIRRIAKGWSQEELSGLANVTPSHLGHIERGDGNPTFNTLLSLCEALQVDIEDVVKGTVEEPAETKGLKLEELQTKFATLSADRQREIYSILKTLISWEDER